MQIQKSLIVIRHQFITALKQITRFKGHTVFSLIGLALGLACVFIISAWTIQELRYDRFHHQAKQIYMVTTDIKDNTGNVSAFPETPQALAVELASKIPQIESAFHFLYLYGGRDLSTKEHTYRETGIAAGSDFLKVLNFKLISGDPGELDELDAIFLSRDLADKLFPGMDPIGRELIYKDDQVRIVKGIFKNCPDNSSLQFDFLISYEAEYGIATQWFQLSDATFIKLLPSADPDVVHSMMRNIWREKVPYEQYDIGMISITDLRYGADFEFFNAEHGHGDRNKLFMFMGVAVLILILACLNYLILASANAIKREKDIWIRKIHGASAGAISSYFIFESVLLSILAWGAASLIAILGIRLFEDLIGIYISPAYFYTSIGLGLVASILIVGVATGFYPAVQAGSQLLVRSKARSRTGAMLQRNLRQLFVGSQFILSIALTISGLVIFRQADFMKRFDSGYSTANIAEFILPANHDTIYHATRDWLEGHPAVQGYSFANASPVNLTVLNTEQGYRWEGQDEPAHTSIFRIHVDEGYLHVFDIPLIKGRFFSPMDENQNRIVINETLAQMMGLDEPLGHNIRRGSETFEIIGVVRDFNFQHLSNEIRAFFFTCNRSQGHLFVRFQTNAENATGAVQEKLSGMSDNPVKTSFVSETRNRLYVGESQILAAILFFTVLCILLSSLGLVGMVSHSASEKTREIAVRKVFGAESRDLMIFQNLYILRMFLPGTLIGSALAWFIMKRWLENYAFRNRIEAWVFLLGPAIILFFTLLSVSFQTWKACRQPPSVTLKYQ